jgi:RNA polymerase sigma-70 factor, ECF subfamily
VAAADPQGRPTLFEIGAKRSMKDATENSGSQRADLVNRIQNGETDGMEELHRLFSQEIRSYLSPQIGPQGLEERLRDALALVIQAIRRGEVREPERLLDFIRTAVNRQVTDNVDGVVHVKAEESAIESAGDVIYAEGFPASGTMRREEEELMKRVLRELSDRDREILTRFYLQEQSQSKICLEMGLSETYFRLLKSRAKARFEELRKRRPG